MVKLYVCGPTVYDDAHLGHARCYLVWDVLYRFLQYAGYTVRYARNVTDIDDKIIIRAQSDGISTQQLTDHYLSRFLEDMAALNILSPTDSPKATESIETMRQGIQALLDNGSAYTTADGSVYFATACKADYGKLGKKPLADLKAGARVETDPNKQSPLDFALWKHAEPDDIGWPAPWGFGRPGWHMECSAMNYALFGDQIDIHAGGADLVFPHHENEIAQSEAWTGKTPFARYWLHNGFVNVSGEKMSKSLGNFATIRTMLARYDANTIRYFLLTHHYRMPVDFNDDALASAENRVQKIHRTIQQTCQALGIQPAVLVAYDWLTVSETSPVIARFTSVMADDLNTPQALAILDESLTTLNRAIHHNGDNDAHLDELRAAFLETGTLMHYLGFNLTLCLDTVTLPDPVIAAIGALVSTYHPSAEALANQPVDAQLQALLMVRTDAKQSKNWPLADGIRQGLSALGIQLMDDAQGTRWEWQPKTAEAVLK